MTMTSAPVTIRSDLSYYSTTQIAVHHGLLPQNGSTLELQQKQLTIMCNWACEQQKKCDQEITQKSINLGCVVSWCAWRYCIYSPSIFHQILRLKVLRISLHMERLKDAYVYGQLSCGWWPQRPLTAVSVHTICQGENSTTLCTCQTV